MRGIGAVAAISACILALSISGCSSIENRNSDIKIFTSFFAVNGEGAAPDNEMQQYIAEKIGAKCTEVWKAADMSAEEAINDMIISGEYPDFVYGGVAQQRLLEAGALVPIDEYWDEYENIRNYFTEEEWDSLRAEDGHIYYIPSYDNVYMHETSPKYYNEAFWIQLKVLEWADYPEIVTLDDYFDLINRYIEANPVGKNGRPNIGYEILTDGYLYFCLENPPQFLDGYPNDGCCIVDAENLEAIDYNTTPTAKKWFRKLNEEYHKGIIDPEFSFLTTDQYYEKIRSGNVIGMADQHWNFSNAETSLDAEDQYVPFDIVISEEIEPRYESERQLDISQGMGISVSCDDVEGAVKFIDDLLSPEIHVLRFWGIEGQDYEIDENGLFYRTDEQTAVLDTEDYSLNHFCRYECFPYYSGMDQDGINAYSPENQPSEYIKTMSSEMKKCLEAYGVKTPAEMINKVSENPPWYPMWSYTNTFTSDTVYGRAKENMDRVKHKYLPMVVISDDFDGAWDEYMQEYSKCDVQSYLDELTAEIRRRAEK